MSIRLITIVCFSVISLPIFAVTAAYCPEADQLTLNSNGTWQATNSLGTWSTNPTQKAPIPKSVDAIYSINAYSILSVIANNSANAQQIECVYQNNKTKQTVSLVTPTHPNKYNIFLQQNGGSWALNADKQSAKCIQSNSFFCAFTY